MAFEGLNKFVDTMAKDYERNQDSRILGVLVVFHEQALESAKFKSQRDYCKQTIRRLCPPFYEGFFEKKKQPTK